MATVSMAARDSAGGAGGGERGPSTMAYSASTNGFNQPFRDANGHNAIPRHPQQIGGMEYRHPMTQAQPTNQHTTGAPTFQHLTATVPTNQMFMQHHHNQTNVPLPPQPPRHAMMPSQGQLPNQQFVNSQNLGMSAFPPQIGQPFMNPSFTFGGAPQAITGQRNPQDMWTSHAGNEWDDERGDFGEGQDMIYGQLEVSPLSLLLLGQNSDHLPSQACEPFAPQAFTFPPSPVSPVFQNFQNVEAPLNVCPYAFASCDGSSSASSVSSVDSSLPSPISPPSGVKNAASFPSVPPPSAPTSPLTPPPMLKRAFDSGYFSIHTHEESYPDASIKVKHRRRTTPEQLKVLEHWFDINPKPDNNLREWLAMELGMTKRNVQVWFQNRRAKVKGIALKEKAAAAKAAAESGESTDNAPQPGQPPSQIRANGSPDRQNSNHIIHPPPRPPALQSVSQPSMAPSMGLMPPLGAGGVNMGRRASLANGEAAKIESFIAKQQRLAAARAGVVSHRPDLISPIQSAAILQGQAQSARRQSIPYPAPGEGGSPKISPSVRQMPSALHLTAIRNNSRRGSVPGGGVQLISSGPFTPPRVVSTGGASGSSAGSGLSTIKDQDMDHTLPDGFTFPHADPNGPFVNSAIAFMPGASNAYLGADTIPGFDLGLDGQYLASSYSTNGPLPNPGFSFGSGALNQNGNGGEGFSQMQGRGRLGSIGSVDTVTTDATTTLDMQDWDWNVGFGQMPDPEGFDPDARRASAPPDLLHNLNYLGLNGNVPMNMSSTSLRPSPLGAFGSDTFSSLDMAPDCSEPRHNGTDAGTLMPVFTMDGSTGSSTSPHSIDASSSEPSPNGGKGGMGLKMAGYHAQYPTGSSRDGYQNVTNVSPSFLTPTMKQQGFEVKKEEHREENAADGEVVKDEFAFFDLPSRDAVKV